MVVNLGEPFLADVLERCGGGDAETHEEDISLRIRERSQTIVIFLTSGIEETERVRLITDPNFDVSKS